MEFHIKDTVCPGCGEMAMQVNLADLPDSKAIRCNECEREWFLDDIRKMLETWPLVMAWIESAPGMAKGK